MSGDPEIFRLEIAATILADLAASLRSAAVVYRDSGPSPCDISGILSTIANKMDLRALSNLEVIAEMARPKNGCTCRRNGTSLGCPLHDEVSKKVVVCLSCGHPKDGHHVRHHPFVPAK